MKIRTSIITFLISIVIVCTGCTTVEPESKGKAEASEAGLKGTSEDTGKGPTESIDEQTGDSATNDFALRVNDTFIHLKDWDYEVNLDEVLGTPISQAVEELGNGADTHTGSLIKRIQYDGLQLELFSPKGNSYPDIQAAPDGRTDANNCAYEIKNEEQSSFVRLEVKEGLVSEMKIYHLVQ